MYVVAILGVGVGVEVICHCEGLDVTCRTFCVVIVVLEAFLGDDVLPYSCIVAPLTQTVELAWL